MTVETGSLTAAVVTLNLVLTVLPNRPGYFLAPIGILGKLYSTSMMAVFNSRITFGVNNSSKALTSVELSTAASSYTATGSRTEQRLQSRGQVPMPIKVKVTQEQVSFPSDEPASFWDDKGSPGDFPIAVAR